MIDDLKIRRGELALLRARNEALAVLAQHIRYDADPGESSVLAAIEMLLSSKLDDDGLLVSGDVKP